MSLPETVFVFIGMHSDLTGSTINIPSQIELVEKLNIAPPDRFAVYDTIYDDAHPAIIKDGTDFTERLLESLNPTTISKYREITQGIMEKIRDGTITIDDFMYVLQKEISNFYISMLEKDDVRDKHPLEHSDRHNSCRLDIFCHENYTLPPLPPNSINIFPHIFEPGKEMKILNKIYTYYPIQQSYDIWWNTIALLVMTETGMIQHNLLTIILQDLKVGTSHHNDRTITTKNILDSLSKRGVKRVLIIDSGCAHYPEELNPHVRRTQLPELISGFGYGGSKLTKKKALRRMSRKYKKQKKSKSRARKSRLGKKSRKYKK
jgi:hypothetical protein